MFHNNTDHISYLQSVKDLATRREVNFNQYFDNICTMHYIDHVEIFSSLVDCRIEIYICNKLHVQYEDNDACTCKKIKYHFQPTRGDQY